MCVCASFSSMLANAEWLGHPVLECTCAMRLLSASLMNGMSFVQKVSTGNCETSPAYVICGWRPMQNGVAAKKQCTWLYILWMNAAIYKNNVLNYSKISSSPSNVQTKLNPRSNRIIDTTRKNLNELCAPNAISSSYSTYFPLQHLWNTWFHSLVISLVPRSLASPLIEFGVKSSFSKLTTKRSHT